MPDCKLDIALKAADRAREIIGEAPFFIPDAQLNLNVTVSVGVVSGTIDANTPDSLLEAADTALYEAKNAGRNCVKAA